MVIRCVLFFFFSSRRRHTRLVSDWSSDVCSSDLREPSAQAQSSGPRRTAILGSDPDVYRPAARNLPESVPALANALFMSEVRTATRSEERRVGKEGRSRRGTYQ